MLLIVVWLYMPLLLGLFLVIKKRKERSFLFWMGVIFLIIFALEFYIEPVREILLFNLMTT